MKPDLIKEKQLRPDFDVDVRTDLDVGIGGIGIDEDEAGQQEAEDAQAHERLTRLAKPPKELRNEKRKPGKEVLDDGLVEDETEGLVEDEKKTKKKPGMTTGLVDEETEGLVEEEEEQHEIVSPRDAASGLPTGKRMHKPIAPATGVVTGTAEMAPVVETATVDAAVTQTTTTSEATAVVADGAAQAAAGTSLAAATSITTGVGAITGAAEAQPAAGGAMGAATATQTKATEATTGAAVIGAAATQAVSGGAMDAATATGTPANQEAPDAASAPVDAASGATADQTAGGAPPRATAVPAVEAPTSVKATEAETTAAPRTTTAPATTTATVAATGTADGALHGPPVDSSQVPKIVSREEREAKETQDAKQDVKPTKDKDPKDTDPKDAAKDAKDAAKSAAEDKSVDTDETNKQDEAAKVVEDDEASKDEKFKKKLGEEEDHPEGLSNVVKKAPAIALAVGPEVVTQVLDPAKAEKKDAAKDDTQALPGLPGFGPEVVDEKHGPKQLARGVIGAVKGTAKPGPGDELMEPDLDGDGVPDKKPAAAKTAPTDAKDPKGKDAKDPAAKDPEKDLEEAKNPGADPGLVGDGLMIPDFEVLDGSFGPKPTEPGPVDAAKTDVAPVGADLDPLVKEAADDPMKSKAALEKVKLDFAKRKAAIQADTAAKAGAVHAKAGAHGVKAHAMGTVKAGSIKAKGTAGVIKAKGVLEVKKVEKAKNIAELKKRLEENFKKKAAELKTNTDKQKGELTEKLNKEKQKIEAELKAQEAKIEQEAATKAKEIDAKIATKRKDLEKQIAADQKKAEATTKAELKKVKDAGDKEAKRIEKEGTTEAKKVKDSGNAEAQKVKSAAHSRAAAARSAGERKAQGALAAANSRASGLEGDAAESARKAGQGQAAAARSRANAEARSIEAEAANQAKAIKEKNEAEAARRIATAKELAQAARDKAAEGVKELEAKLEQTKQGFAKQLADGIAAMDKEKQQLLADAKKAAEEMRAKHKKAIEDATFKISTQEKDSLKRIEDLEAATKKALQTSHDDMLIKLESGKESDLAKLEEETNAACKKIDDAVLGAQQGIDREVKLAADKAAFVVAKLVADIKKDGDAAIAKIQAQAAEVQKKIEAIDAETKTKLKATAEKHDEDTKVESKKKQEELAAHGDKAVEDVKKDSDVLVKEKAEAAAAEAKKKAEEEKAKAEEERKAKEAEAKKEAEKKADEERKKKEFEQRTKGAADSLFKAMDGWGTDEKAIFNALKGRSPEEIAAIKAAYKAKSGRDLDADLADEMSGSELGEAKALLKGDPVMSAVHALNNATGGWGTDEDKVKATLANLDPETKKKVIAEFEKATGKRLSAVLEEEGMKDEGINPGDYKKEETPPAIDPNAPKREVNEAAMKKAVTELEGAMDRWGTDEAAIHNALKGKTPEEIEWIKKMYAERNGGKSLEEALESEMDGTDLKEAKALLTADPVQAAVAQLHNAADGIGTDEEKIKATLKGITDPELRKKVEEEYEKQTGEKLSAMLKDEMSGFDKDLAEAYMTGDKAKIAAVEADQAMHGGFLTDIADGIADTMGVDREITRKATGMAVGVLVGGPAFLVMGAAGGYAIGTDFGTDEKALYAALESCKTKEERDALAKAYKERTGKDLKADVDSEMSGKEKDVTDALLEGDKIKAEAAKMAAAADGVGTDKKAIYEALEKAESKAERDAIIAKFNELYGKEYVDKDGKRSGFEQMMHEELDKLDAEKGKQLASKGKMDDGFALYYAMNEGFLGIGTDDDLLKERLKGKSKKEIEELEKEYKAAAERMGDKDADLKKDVASETSGRVGHELGQSLKGKPETLEEMRLRAKEDYEFERKEGGWIGEVGMAVVLGPVGYLGAKAMGIDSSDVSNAIVDTWSGSGKRLDKDYLAMEAEFEKLKKELDASTVGMSPEEKKKKEAELMTKLRDKVEWQEGSIEQYEKAKDAAADAVGTGVAIAVGAVLTIATGGAASPILVALISGLAGVSATMIVKGASMSNEELVQSVAAVVAEAAAMGVIKLPRVDAFLKNIEKLAGGNQKLIARILKEACEEAIESGSEALFTALVDPENYKGDLADWAKGVSAATGKAAFTGFVAGGVATGVGEMLPQPIPKLGKDGKPLLDANGKPIYSTGALVRKGVNSSVQQGVGAAASTAIEPSTWEGSGEDVFNRFARSVGEGMARGFREGFNVNTDDGGHKPLKTDTKTDTKVDTTVDTTGTETKGTETPVADPTVANDNETDVKKDEAAVVDDAKDKIKDVNETTEKKDDLAAETKDDTKKDDTEEQRKLEEKRKADELAAKQALQKLAELEVARLAGELEAAKLAAADEKLTGDAKTDAEKKLAKLQAEYDAAKAALGKSDTTVTDAEKGKEQPQLKPVEKNHSGVEVHNHFLGVVPVDVFVEFSGGTAEKTLFKLAEMEKLDPTVAKNAPHNSAVIHQAIADLAVLDTMMAEAKTEAEKKAILEYRNEIATEAVTKALTATGDTPFDGSYEYRDALIKFVIDKDSKGTKGQRTYEKFTQAALEALIMDGITYSEQSQSLNKLTKGVFEPEMMVRAIEAVKAKLAAKGIDAEIDVRWLVMLETKFLALSMETAQKAYDPNDPRNQEKYKGMSEDDARAAWLADQQAEFERQLAATEKLLLEYKDLIPGMDIASPEKFVFSEQGKENFKKMYDMLQRVAKQTGRPMVLRPHVGEGYVENEGKKFDRDNPKKGESGLPQHYDIAKQNMDALLDAIQELVDAKKYDPTKSPEENGVLIRFGHATHCTPEQAARMKALGIIAEVNLGSNIESGALDAKGAQNFDDHSLLHLIYFDVQTILSTDAHSVMNTNLEAEYERAAKIIADFVEERTLLRLPGPDGKEILVTFGELMERDPEAAKRFLEANKKLRDWATDYKDKAKKWQTEDKRPELQADADKNKGKDQKGGTASTMEGSTFRADTTSTTKIDAETVLKHAMNNAGLVLPSGALGFEGDQAVLMSPKGERVLVKLVTETRTDDQPARFEPAGDNQYVVYVNDKLPESMVTRALAHELTEIQAKIDKAGGKVNTAAVVLTEHQQGRIGELKVVMAQLAALDTTTDAAKLRELQNEVKILLGELGLGKASPASVEATLGGYDSDLAAKVKALVEASAKVETTVPPAPVVTPAPTDRPAVTTDPKADANQDGVQDAARVGVAGMEVPDLIPRLQNLTAEERAAETRFATAYENDPEKLAAEYLALVMSGKVDKEAKNFATDDAKLLSPDYNPETGTDAEKLAARGLMNIAVHQTANAIAKKAFLMRLDQIAKDPGASKKILVTAGGVGAGKSYAIENNPQALALKNEASVVWDSAGEQNSTELPWVIAEAKARGLEVAIVYVHRRPEQSWENMKFGVIPRAEKSGRMVDARLHADSYAEGARNFDAVQKQFGEDPGVNFIVIDATEAKPQQIDQLPEDALNLDADKVHARNVAFLESQKGVSDHVKKGGAEIGERIWGGAIKAMPSSVAEAEALKLMGLEWDDKEVRAHYLAINATIEPLNAEWVKQGLSAEERAKKAHEIRHNARVTARAMMGDAQAVEALRQRDLAEYGNPDGPTFEDVVKKYAAKGLTGDALYEAIISSSQRTNKAVNEKMGLKSDKESTTAPVNFDSKGTPETNVTPVVESTTPVVETKVTPVVESTPPVVDTKKIKFSDEQKLRANDLKTLVVKLPSIDTTKDSQELREFKRQLHAILFDLGLHAASPADVETALADLDAGLAATVRAFQESIPKNKWGVEEFPKTLADDDPLLVETNKKEKTPTGEDRAEWRKNKVEEILTRDGAKPVEDGKPILYIMGGGGASGKGTLKDILTGTGVIPADNVVKIDPDEIKSEIPEYHQIIGAGDSRAAAVVHEESSELAKEVLSKAYERKLNILFDVTLGDPSKGVMILERAKAMGYEIRLFGVSVDAETAIQRNLDRAKKSGRYVPPESQLGAHKGFSRGFELYAELADEAHLYDTSGAKPELMANKEQGEGLEIVDEEKFKEFKDKGNINLEAKGLGDLYSEGGATASETAPTKEEYLKKAMANLARSSRTAAGNVDTSAGGDKAKSMADISGADAAVKATENYAGQIGLLHDNKDKKFASAAELRDFVETVAKDINKGITKEGELIRKHDSEATDKRAALPYTKVDQLESAMQQFYDEFLARLGNPAQDPVELAAWVEYRINLTDHFFADGCGKTSSAIAAWVLMRAGHKLPNVPERSTTFANAPLVPLGSDPSVDAEQWKVWVTHYRRLFGGD